MPRWRWWLWGLSVVFGAANLIHIMVQMVPTFASMSGGFTTIPLPQDIPLAVVM